MSVSYRPSKYLHTSTMCIGRYGSLYIYIVYYNKGRGVRLAKIQRPSQVMLATHAPCQKIHASEIRSTNGNCAVGKLASMSFFFLGSKQQPKERFGIVELMLYTAVYWVLLSW